jgi:hypothetical protein
MNRQALLQSKQTSIPTRLGGRLLQRKCACGNHTVAGAHCDRCAQEKSELRRNASHRGEYGEVPPIVHEVLRSPGQPLDASTLAFFEPRFGRDFSSGPARSETRAASVLSVIPSNDKSEREATDVARRVLHSTEPARKRTSSYDFSGVRVHTDSRASQSARALNARAYTVGNEIVFADGQFGTTTLSGGELIAHELTHVAQAGANSPSVTNALHCKKFETNETDCTATMRYLVQIIFEDHEKDVWNTPSMSRAVGRKIAFRDKFKHSVEDTFNGSPFRIKPDIPCANTGFKPKLQLDLVKEGDWSVSEDWEVKVRANPSSKPITSSTNLLWGTSELDEADVNPVVKEPQLAPGVTQTPAVHEFGHFIGLEHPGAGIGSNKPNEDPEYTYAGSDIKGRDVKGLGDLMGTGMGMRPFYFDKWSDEVNDKYARSCSWKVK